MHTDRHKVQRRAQDAQQAVTTLSGMLWHALWPDDAKLRGNAQSRVMLGDLPAAEARIPAVAEAADVSADDLLVIVDLTGASNASVDVFGVLTGKEVMELAPFARVAKVLSTTAKTVSVVMIPTPRDGWECNLDGFAERSYDPTPITLTVKTKTRRIGRLGTASEIRQRISDHPLFGEWQRAYENAKTAQREVETAVTACEAAEALRQQALKRVAAIVNRALGAQMISDAGGGSVRLHFSDYHHFFRQKENLRVHLAGLHAVGKLTADEHELVTEQLTVAGMLTEPSKTPS
ncbi:hypothetical protein ACIBBE_23990 [Streptomyces sp. NPDC051644]|uniref:hypothetical protein n=1 Tax=Streptomyces sp. NPDC051644 TaxID=3365666 RepID=UPI00379C1BFE